MLEEDETGELVLLGLSTAGAVVKWCGHIFRDENVQ